MNFKFGLIVMMAWNFDLLQGSDVFSVICLLQNEYVRHSVCCYEQFGLECVISNKTPFCVLEYFLCLNSYDITTVT